MTMRQGTEIHSFSHRARLSRRGRTGSCTEYPGNWQSHNHCRDRRRLAYFMCIFLSMLGMELAALDVPAAAFHCWETAGGSLSIWLRNVFTCHICWSFSDCFHAGIPLRRIPCWMM